MYVVSLRTVYLLLFAPVTSLGKTIAVNKTQKNMVNFITALFFVKKQWLLNKN